jgi:hypothetical protein
MVRKRADVPVDGFRKVFNQVDRAAREEGVVKDRLRIKDATHVIGNMVVPTALVLVAQARDTLLAAAEPLVPLMAEGERANLELLRETTQSRTPGRRLEARLAQLREILVWAQKIFEDQEDPHADDQTLSSTDPDARRGKHSQWDQGYLPDLVIDADNEQITQINVLVRELMAVPATKIKHVVRRVCAPTTEFCYQT